jgi:hypothetical protein
VKLRIISLLLLIIFAAVPEFYSQLPQAPADNSAQRREAERRIEAERALRTQNMREFDTVMQAANKPRRSEPANPTIDKETSDGIRLARRVNDADLARYSQFLQSDKTGLFKLFPDYDCVTKNVIRTDGDCKNFIMASSSFSFRTRGYIHPYYHDLGFNHGEISSNAFFLQGVFVSLGNVPIENVTPGHEGLKFIYDLKASSEPDGARSMGSRIKSGVESGGFAYSSSVKPAENMTFALRSIAYDLANSLPPVSETTSSSELRFHTLSLDKRADVIVVFRIVRKDEDGSLTIVWKELDRREAPKIKFLKGEKFVDFKPAQN